MIVCAVVFRLCQPSVFSSRFGFFEQCYDLLTSDAGELAEKVVDRVAGFEVVKQRSDRYARADETRRSALNIFVDADDRGSHTEILTPMTGHVQSFYMAAFK